MSKFSYMINDGTCSIILNGKSHSFEIADSDWSEVSDILNNGNPEDDGDRLVEMTTFDHMVTNAIDSFNDETVDEACGVRIELVDDVILFDGMRVDNALTERIYEIIRLGLDISHWLVFAENIYKNPLDSARTELYEWLAKGKMPITEDGHFLAFKKVNKDYKDIHSNTFDNSVGAIVEMDRSKVDTNRYNTCSAGLHFCSAEYLPNFGRSYGEDKVVVVKVNPADVVSIPIDYNNSKGRTWRYEVVDEMPTAEAAARARFSAVIDSDDISWTDEEEDLDYYNDCENDFYEDDDEDFVQSNVAETLATVTDETKTSFWQGILDRVQGKK